MGHRPPYPHPSRNLPEAASGCKEEWSLLYAPVTCLPRVPWHLRGPATLGILPAQEQSLKGHMQGHRLRLCCGAERRQSPHLSAGLQLTCWYSSFPRQLPDTSTAPGLGKQRTTSGTQA